MRFYTQQHQFYCGIDLHARSMCVCIMNREGEILRHRNMATTADELVKVIEPYRSDVVLAVECIFTWYWIADLCHQLDVEFVLVHALYMKAMCDMLSLNYLFCLNNQDKTGCPVICTLPG